MQQEIEEQVSKLVEERLQALLQHFAAEDGANPFADFKGAISEPVAESTRRASRRREAIAEALQRVETERRAS